MQKSVENIRNEAGIKKQTKINVKDKYRSLVGIMMNLMAEDDEYAQMQCKKGVKKLGNKAVQAMSKECCQLGDDGKEAFIPMHASRLTREQKRKALRMLALIKKAKR